MPMPIQTTPEALEPYLCLGLDLHSHGEEWTCSCPFCDSDKFSVNSKNGLWQCWSCRTGNAKGGGNIDVFVHEMWKLLDENTSNYSSIATERGLRVDTVMAWGFVWSPYRRMWMAPGYNPVGEVRNLYRYGTFGKKKRLVGTKGLSHGIFGVNLYRKELSNVWVFEGIWDGAKAWELMSQIRPDDEGFKPTASKENLLSDINVLAVPGCRSFREQWCSLFEGKEVTLIYDNDHPRINEKTGTPMPSDALEGLKRTTQILMRHSKPPASIRYLRWGEEDYHDIKLLHGFDFRDALATL